ncbi:uncharacterized protein B0I36DRAFT_278974 [Microdochium trichocladiopsis]|uniref:C2H2-type domain-containing protein n=1 Tax=Microdochium trichocladiopsis TaxID=1682393 RepID=A0A9P8XTH4_9PEZI|nr:uncharacterized protein B0I36DRAFT_278974 [Microdochium trichocladiopsis]KAH7012029.1 hypothetical protein B0I36DRAFT_278974 [Microdochium trichocladiopsis]
MHIREPAAVSSGHIIKNLAAPKPYDHKQRTLGIGFNVSSEHKKRTSSRRSENRCRDHGCNGKRFSTNSNLRRHQREKSGMNTKVACLQCGKEFTRSTALRKHPCITDATREDNRLDAV